MNRGLREAKNDIIVFSDASIILEDDALLQIVKPFLDEAFKGVKRFDKELIELLRKGGSHHGNEILVHLNIDPSETELVKAVNKQLEILEHYGLVEYMGKGWKWKARH